MKKRGLINAIDSDVAVGRNEHDNTNMNMKQTKTIIVINSRSTRLIEWGTDLLLNKILVSSIALYMYTTEDTYHAEKLTPSKKTNNTVEVMNHYDLPLCIDG